MCNLPKHKESLSSAQYKKKKNRNHRLRWEVKNKEIKVWMAVILDLFVRIWQMVYFNHIGSLVSFLFSAPHLHVKFLGCGWGSGVVSLLSPDRTPSLPTKITCHWPIHQSCDSTWGQRSLMFVSWALYSMKRSPGQMQSQISESLTFLSH